MSRFLRAAAAALAVAAYALPLALGLVTNAVHDAYHLREFLDLGATEVALGEDVDPSAFVHAHGGSGHSHGATTDALLSVAERTDEPADEHHAPTLELVGHVPASGVLVEAPSVEGRIISRGIPDAAPASPAPPPLPPPRA